MCHPPRPQRASRECALSGEKTLYEHDLAILYRFRRPCSVVSSALFGNPCALSAKCQSDSLEPMLGQAAVRACEIKIGSR